MSVRYVFHVQVKSNLHVQAAFQVRHKPPRFIIGQDVWNSRVTKNLAILLCLADIETTILHIHREHTEINEIHDEQYTST